MKKFLRLQTTVKAGQVTLYGSPDCGWCQKQKANFDSQGIDYTFVDCTTNECPDFVTGYPTTVISGFTAF